MKLSRGMGGRGLWGGWVGVQRWKAEDEADNREGLQIVCLPISPATGCLTKVAALRSEPRRLQGAGVGKGLSSSQGSVARTHLAPGALRSGGPVMPKQRGPGGGPYTCRENRNENFLMKASVRVLAYGRNGKHPTPPPSMDGRGPSPQLRLGASPSAAPVRVCTCGEERNPLRRQARLR